MEGKNATARVIDGGEMYCLHTRQDFEEAYDWQRYGMASDQTSSAFVPSALRPIWRDTISVAYGVYNQTSAIGNGCRGDQAMTPELYRSTALEALKRADHYVWLFVETTSFVRGGTPAIGQDYIDAIKSAKTAYSGQ